MNTADSFHLEAGSGGPGLCVRFHWSGDRYGHRITLTNQPDVAPLMESIERGVDPTRPPSPPIQQLTWHDRSGPAPALLGVGMAGRNHWSLSVQVSHDPPSVEFDVACRVRDDGGHWFSSYRIISASARGTERSAVIEPHHSRVPCQLEILPAESEARTVVGTDEGRVTVAAASDPTIVPSTIRWKYRIWLGGPGGAA